MYDCQQKLILITSSIDGMNPVNSAMDPVKQFYKQISAKNAKLYVLNTLRSVFRCNINIYLGLATTICLFAKNFSIGIPQLLQSTSTTSIWQKSLHGSLQDKKKQIF